MASIFLGPVVVGLLGTWLPAMGYFPALGEIGLSWQPLLDFYQHPGMAHGFFLSFTTGVFASVFALIATLIILIGLYPSTLFKSVWLPS
jgi:putative thiamine transport system permease protein